MQSLALALALVVTAPTTPAFSAPPSIVRGLDIEIPKNDGWVTDLAGMLNPAAERALEELMESYKQGSTHEIALLTVPSLKGQPIERFALQVGRAWGIGGKELNNGALLVASKEDRALRIEVGRGLEGNLTDSISGRIIRDVIVPEFQNGDYVTGLRQGIEAMHAAIGGDYAKVKRSRPARPDLESEVGRILPMLLIAILVFFVRVSNRLRRGRRRGTSVFPGMYIPPIGGGSLGRSRGWGGGRSSGGGGFSGFGGGGGFSGGGASGRW
jgi:uncharacterized protein